MIDIGRYERIHCIGIGGVGVSAIAEILLSRGKIVSGSDMSRSAITDHLESLGAKIYTCHKEENVEGTDLIIYSAAIAEENPEFKRAMELGIPMASRAQVLGSLMREYDYSIAISGTHGKTTTTSMVALILENGKKDPTILVGGNLPEIKGNAKVGESEFFVTEACEYRDSFLELEPKIEVILNIDSDHLDYFKDLEHIVSSFDKFAHRVPQGGLIIAYDSNPFIKSIVDKFSHVITFGYNKGCTYHITNVSFENAGMPSFDIEYKGENLGRVSLRIPGEHNILNAAAAFACCHQLGVEAGSIIETLRAFNGTDRRFDIVGTSQFGLKIVDDYAHHPTEIRATLSASKRLPHERIITCFQPHTYTRTLALFDQFADSFEDTDILILSEIYAAREKNIYKISSKKLAEEIRNKHPEKEVYFAKSLEDVAEKVRDVAKEGDLVITMGAGDIYKVGKMLMED